MGIIFAFFSPSFLYVACNDQALLIFAMLYMIWSVPGRVRVAVRLRPRNAEEQVADADFADCVELQPEVNIFYFILSSSWVE